MGGYRAAAVGLILLVVTGCTTAVSSNSDRDAAVELGQLKERLDQVDQDIDAIQLQEPITVESIRRYAAEVGAELPRYEPIRDDILAMRDEVQDAQDEDVFRAGELLAVMVEQRYEGMKDFLTTVEAGEFTEESVAELERIYDDVNETNAEFAEVANRLNETYAD